MSDRSKIMEVISEIVKDKILNFLKRYCKCIQAREEYRDILDSSLIDELSKAIEDKRDVDLGSIKIYFRKRFLSTKMCIEYRGQTYCNDDAMLVISRIRSIYEWYKSDCNLNNILADTVENNDFNLITFLERNLKNIENICRGNEAELDFSMLDDAAKIGVDRAIKQFKNELKQ